MVKEGYQRKGDGYIRRTLAVISSSLLQQSGLREAVTRWVSLQTDDFTLHDLCKNALRQDITRMNRDQVIRLCVLLKDIGCTRIEKRVPGNPARFWWRKPAEVFSKEGD